MQNLALFKIVTPNDGMRKMVVLDAFRVLTVPKILSLVSLFVITERKRGRIQDVMPHIKSNLLPPLAALISESHLCAQ